MFGLIKKFFVLLWSRIVSVSNHEKSISLTNHRCMIQATIISSHPNEYSKSLSYYPFIINLYSCVSSCSTLDNLSNGVRVPKKQNKDFNLSVFKIIVIIKSKVLIKHLSWKCECKSDGWNCHSNKKGNNNECHSQCKNPI